MRLAPGIPWDKIVGVGPSATLAPGANVIDLGDATLLRGFVDAHVHITNERGMDSRQSILDAHARTPAETARVATRHMRATLYAGYGTDARVCTHGTMMAASGLSQINALKAATSSDAELLGIAEETGAMETGKLAGIVAVPGNPVQDIARTRDVIFVMKSGKIARHTK